MFCVFIRSPAAGLEASRRSIHSKVIRDFFARKTLSFTIFVQTKHIDRSIPTYRNNTILVPTNHIAICTTYTIGFQDSPFRILKKIHIYIYM